MTRDEMVTELRRLQEKRRALKQADPVGTVLTAIELQREIDNLVTRISVENFKARE